jgi:hypothetical protein
VSAERRRKPEGSLWIDDHLELVKLLSALGRHDEAEQMVPLVWRETKELPAAWHDDSFVQLVCRNLKTICLKWQAVTHLATHDQDIAMWTAKQEELEATRGHNRKL